MLLSALTACSDDRSRGAGAVSGPPTDNVFMAVVPPGTNGNSAGGVGGPAGIPPEQTQYPDNYEDQLHLYGNLAYAKSPMVLPAEGCKPPVNFAAHEPASDDPCNYYKNAPIVIPEGEEVAAKTVALTAPNGKAVTIRRDGWGVPYIDGEDRQSAQYGLGYAAAQDRLWLFDLLRNVGRGRASQFLGPADDLYSEDRNFGGPAGYSEDELTAIVNAAVAKIGEPLGPMFLEDVQSFVAGMNAYVAFLQGEGADQVPQEYNSLGAGAVPPLFPPPDFTVNDIVANAVLIQSALGFGGGGENKNVKLLQTLDASFGPDSTSIPKAACEMWRDLRHANAPDTPHTASGTFATQSGVVSEECPQVLPAGVAIWDKDSLANRVFHTHEAVLPIAFASPAELTPSQMIARIKDLLTPPALLLADANLTPPLRPGVDTAQLALLRDSVAAVRDLLASSELRRTSSNFIAVNASETQSGHPIMVGGPQTSYFNPQLLWEAAVISRGGTAYELAARGISTVNLPYIVIGHGLDFAWSPTSAGSDFTDTRVSLLCNIPPNVLPPSRDDANGDGFPDADGYMYKGSCKRFYKRVDEWTAMPTAASYALGCTGSPPEGGPGGTDEKCHELPETVRRYILRTHYGPVFATATVKGVPVAVSTQRSTFMSDVDTAAPFALLTTTGLPMDHLRYRKLFNSMTATFNWLYTDENDIAYIQSGLYPKRHAGHNPELPVWGDGNFEWVVDNDLPADFFTNFGGDETGDGDNDDGVIGGTINSFPSRTQPVKQDAQGYYEWPGFLSLAEHIQDVNPAQGYLTSWNNSGAAGWWAADGNGTFGPTHRVEMLRQRLAAFKASGRKHTLATMIEIAADAAYTDHRGLDLLPLLIQIMQNGTLTADQQSVVDLMQAWMADGSQKWISNGNGLGAMRRDRDASGTYDYRAQVVLMDAWYRRLMDSVTPQMVAIESAGASLLTGRLDAPRAQGSAFQEGWYQHMQRMLRMALGDPALPAGAQYRQLKCAGTGTPANCRAAVLTALDLALADLGGLADQANWDGSTITNAKGGDDGAVVEDYDAVEHSNFGFLPISPIHWINRPTFHQAAEIGKDRTQQ